MLEIDGGTQSSAFVEVTAYPTSPTYPGAYTITTTDGLVEGRIYTIRWYAKNDVGNGPSSDSILVAASDKLPAPTSLVKD